MADYICTKIEVMYRTHTCGELRLSDINKEVTLAGWVAKNRDLGGMTFVDLRDRYGVTQVAFNEEQDKELLEKAREVSRECVIQVIGKVVERSSKNDRIPTGEIEIEATEITLLNRSKVPPFTIEDKTDGGDEIRMKYRYLDLRRNPVRNNLMLRHRVSKEIHLDLFQQ